MKELEDILLHHSRTYPLAQPEDMVKLLYQSEFAGGHMIPDESAALAGLEAECAGISPSEDTPHFEDIGNGLCRLYLSGNIGDIVALRTLNRFFVYTSNIRKGSIESFEQKLILLSQLCATGRLPFATIHLQSYLAEYREKGYPAVSHSSVYRESYAPHYRVIDKNFHNFFDVFTMLDKLLTTQKTVTIAIDGNSGSGKSRLAEMLSKVYDCNVFHMDDFFLTPDIRTEERFAEPGGNVDYERFKTQVIDNLHTGMDFTYQVFDCGRLEFNDSSIIHKKQLNIVEGVYSLHPMFRKSFDFCIFLSTEEEIAKRRILVRNGKAMLQRFVNEWIPLENSYFTQTNAAAFCDLVIDTSAMH